jgi:hypothetical protein
MPKTGVPSFLAQPMTVGLLAAPPASSVSSFARVAESHDNSDAVGTFIRRNVDLS